MSTKSTEKKFNLPAYINTPFFLYTDSRLDKSATNIASFFYSLHTSGKSINVSTEYLCELSGVKKRQLYKILNTLEDCSYISRTGSTNKRVILWVYSTNSTITIIDNTTSALEDTSYQTSALQCTKLVHSSTLNLCTPVHTYNKVDTKVDKNIRTKQDLVSQDPFLSTQADTEDSPKTPTPLKVVPCEYKETYYPITKEKKKELKTKDVINDNPHNIPTEMIEDWLINRKAKRSPLTYTAWNQLNNQLSQCDNPIMAFSEMVGRGWVTLKADWVTKKENKSHFDNESTDWIKGINEEMF